VHGASFTAGTLVRGVRRRLRTGARGGLVPAPAVRLPDGALDTAGR
jgi:hypothetical protein